MNVINKQKFLAELGKLLTFMYEEDRQTALAMYVKMFEDAEDEQALIQALISPTRQAVIVARAYDAKERKLQVQAQSREEAGEAPESEAMPGFVLAINQVYQEAVPAKADASAPLENQFSLFEEDMPDGEALLEETEEAAEEVEEVIAEAAAEAAEVEEMEEPAAAEDTAEAALPPETADEPGAEAETEPEAEAALPEAEAPEEAGADTEETELSPAEPEETPSSAEEPAEDARAQAEEAAVEAFLADFAIAEDMPQEEELPLEEPRYPEAELTEAAETAPAVEAVLEEDEEEEPEESPVSRTPGANGVRRRPKALLLILYILLAIPITLVCVAVLLIPALLFLALAFGVIAAGSAALMTAFSGFPVFADILIVLGAALIVLALGLLFLWIFIWFIGGAIAGVIRGVIKLGAKWCYEEVPA